MARVWIPALVRDLTGGVECVDAPGATVRDALDAVERRYVGVKSRLCDGENLRSGIVVVVDSQVAPLGLRQSVGEESEVHFLPAIGGGSM